MALCPPSREIALFSGAAGLSLGLKLAVPGLRTVCHVEREAYAAACLVARMEDAALDPAPVWSDVTTFDGTPWRGVVDLVAGGFPCQDVSNAGKRAGLDGERSGLWREFARIIADVRPRYVFIENVSALRSRGLDRVLGDLAALGFDAEWDCFRASDVGAPHRRERIFILAHHHGDELRDESGRGRGPSGQGQAEPGDAREDVADDDDDRRQGVGGRGLLDGQRAPCRGDADGRGRALADVGDDDDEGRQGRGVRGLVGPYERAPWPPGPEDALGWRDYLARWPGLEPAVYRGADGLAYRVERLRLCGNGVVPDQAALAWRVLFDRIGAP